MVSTIDLHRRYGLHHNVLPRLIARKILTPIGPGGSGSAWEWDEAEQRAAAAVVAFARSHLTEDRGGKRAYMDHALRAIAESARTHQPGDPSVRWIMLLGDGTCLRVGDELAASWPEARTLIEIVDNPAVH